MQGVAKDVERGPQERVKVLLVPLILKHTCVSVIAQYRRESQHRFSIH